MVHKNPAHALEHPSIRRPPTRVSIGKFLALGMTLWLGACADSPCPEGLTHAGGQCVSSDDMPDATAQETGGANAHVDAETPDAAPMPTDAAMPDGSSPDGTDAAMPDGSSPDVADASDSTVPELMDATPPDPCITAVCGDNSECVVDDDTAHCDCLRGYIKGALGCERDECQTLTEEDRPACGANASCEDPTAEAEDFECNCSVGFSSCDGEDDPEPGCETNLQDNADHCGACGYACAGNLKCLEGKCEQAADRLVLNHETSCFLKTDEKGNYDAVCSGSNDNFQLRLGGLNDRDRVVDSATPASLSGIGPIRDISLGQFASCVIPRAGQTIECWGNNNYLGRGHSSTQLPYDKLNTIQLLGAEEVGLGTFHGCARTTAGHIYCWGSSSLGQLGANLPGNPTPTEVDIPQRVPNIQNADSLSVGGTYSCAIEAPSGHVVCWGAIGMSDDQIEIRAPALILDTRGQPIKADVVSLGSQTTYWMTTSCAVLKSKRLACWGALGASLHGRLPNVQGRDDHVAVELPLENVIDVAVSLSRACALLENGELHCWGEANQTNNSLSSNPTIGPELKPLPDGINDVIDIAAGSGHLCIRRRSGAVLCQGVDDRGQLGDGAAQTANTWQLWSPVATLP